MAQGPQLPISLTRNPDDLPAELLQEYEPLGQELLGEGAFAVVRLLRSRASGELFALKCVEKHPMRIRNLMHQMQREVRIQGHLAHPNILQLVKSFDDQRYLYMLLEYCAKGSLRVSIVEQPGARLHEYNAAFYFRQIVCGVEWMHTHSCVHRDLKVENMLLTEDDVVKICDFGWSAEVEIEQMLKTVCGTTAFWAPEIWENAPQDEGVDLWALGCLLYEMLAGHPPFWTQDQLELRSQVLAARFAVPPWFSEDARSAVDALLQRVPEQRMRCADLPGHAWLRGLHGVERPLPALPSGVQTAAESWQQPQVDVVISGGGSGPAAADSGACSPVAIAVNVTSCALEADSPYKPMSSGASATTAATGAAAPLTPLLPPPTLVKVSRGQAPPFPAMTGPSTPLPAAAMPSSPVATAPAMPCSSAPVLSLPPHPARLVVSSRDDMEGMLGVGAGGPGRSSPSAPPPPVSAGRAAVVTAPGFLPGAGVASVLTAGRLQLQLPVAAPSAGVTGVSSVSRPRAARTSASMGAWTWGMQTPQMDDRGSPPVGFHPALVAPAPSAAAYPSLRRRVTPVPTSPGPATLHQARPQEEPCGSVALPVGIRGQGPWRGVRGATPAMPAQFVTPRVAPGFYSQSASTIRPFMPAAAAPVAAVASAPVGTSVRPRRRGEQANAVLVATVPPAPLPMPAALMGHAPSFSAVRTRVNSLSLGPLPQSSGNLMPFAQPPMLEAAISADPTRAYIAYSPRAPSRH